MKNITSTLQSTTHYHAKRVAYFLTRGAGMMRQFRQSLSLFAGLCLVASLMSSTAVAQLVCLPAPRLLTTMPMGGQVGTSFDVTITGQNIEDTDELSFSNPGITATKKLGKDGEPVSNTYVVSIAKDCPPGIHEARVMTRLGVSSTRVFNVGMLPEVMRAKPNTLLENALKLELNSLCNAVMTAQKNRLLCVRSKEGATHCC